MPKPWAHLSQDEQDAVLLLGKLHSDFRNQILTGSIQFFDAISAIQHKIVADPAPGSILKRAEDL